MMNPLMWLGFVFSACVFAVIFLVSIIVYGGDAARYFAISAAFLGCVSQFLGQDQRTWKGSIVTAWAAFVIALAALGAFVSGA